MRGKFHLESDHNTTALDVTWDDLESAFDDMVEADRLSRVAWGGLTAWRMQASVIESGEVLQWTGFLK